MKEKIFNFEDRLVAFAGNVIGFNKTLLNDNVGRYYNDQILRSSGSAALHYGEAQGTVTAKDFIHKMSQVLKELRETIVSLKILDRAKYGDVDKIKYLIQEATELAAISGKMILNKQQSVKASPKK